MRQRMIRELQLQRKSDHTIDAYVLGVRQLAEHYGRSSEQISHDEVRNYLHHLIVDRKLATGSVNVKLAAIGFLYREVLRRDFDLRVPRRQTRKLPEPLSREEVRRLLEAVQNAKHRCLLMTSLRHRRAGRGTREPASRRYSLRADAGACASRQGTQGPLHAVVGAAVGRVAYVLATRAPETLAVS